MGAMRCFKQNTLTHAKHTVSCYEIWLVRKMRENTPHLVKKQTSEWYYEMRYIEYVLTVLWCWSCLILRLKVCVLFSDVCGDLAPSLLSGDVPEAAVPSGEGKRDTPPPPPSSPPCTAASHGCFFTGWPQLHHPTPHTPLHHLSVSSRSEPRVGKCFPTLKLCSEALCMSWVLRCYNSDLRGWSCPQTCHVLG